MGTNYYRVPKPEVVEEYRKQFHAYIDQLTPLGLGMSIGNGIMPIDYDYDWTDEQGHALLVHLGKRSVGWKFNWNFHRNKFYSNKEELLAFIREGQVYDEYGVLQDTEEFIKMALEWCQEDGFDSESYHQWMVDGMKGRRPLTEWERIHQADYSYEIAAYNRQGGFDYQVDGLRVSKPQETSTYFC